MEAYKKLESEALDMVLEMEKYSGRPTKASSARIRKHILAIQKLAVEAKKDLLKQDKGE